MKKTLVMICIVALGLGLANISCAQREGAVNAGEKAENFTLNDLSGNPVSLQDAVKANKATLLVFWATWCPYCVKEVPTVKKFYSDYKDKGLKILAIDIGESAQKAKLFAAKQGIEYTVLLDTDNRVASQYGVSGIPMNILIDNNNIIKYAGNAPPDESLLPNK